MTDIRAAFASPHTGLADRLSSTGSIAGGGLVSREPTEAVTTSDTSCGGRHPSSLDVWRGVGWAMLFCLPFWVAVAFSCYVWVAS
jgi:hypothetical protein